jgi:hypothetical protein
MAKKAALESHLAYAEGEAEYLGKYYNYDEATGSYLYDVAAMEQDGLSKEKRKEIEEELNTLQEIND